MVTTPYYTGQDFGPKEGTAYAAVMPQEGMRYVYDQQGTRHSVPINFNVSSGGGYTSLYKDDPIAAELAAGIQGTDVYQGSPYALANVPEFEGVRYATPDYNRYQDLYSLYMGGGFDAAQDDFVTPPADTTPVDTGGDGGGDVVNQLGTVNEYTGINTLADIDTGVGEFDDLGPVDTGGDTIMPPMLDQTGQMGMDTVVDTTPDYPGAGTANPIAINRGTPISEMGTRPPDFVAGAQTFTDPDPGATNPRVSQEVIDALAQTPPGGGDPDMFYDEPVNLIERDPMGNPRLSGAKTVTTTPDSTMPPMLDPTGQMGASNYQAQQTTDFPDQVDFDQGFIDAGDYSAPGTLADPAEKMDFVTGQDTSESLYQKAKNYLGEKVADSIDWTSVIAKGLLNSYIGKPVSLLFDAVGATLPPGGPTLQTSKAQSIGLAGEGEYQDKYGINTQSAFGDYDQYNIDRVEELETALEKAKGKYDTEQEYLDMTTRLRQELEDRKEYNKISGVGGDIDDDPTGDAQIAEQIAAEERAAEKARIEAERRRLQEINAAEQARAAEQAEAERIAAEKAEAERVMQEQIRAAEIEAERRRLQEINAAQQGSGDNQGMDQGGGQSAAGAGGGSQQAKSGGSSPSGGWGGGWGWSKGGIVSLKNGKR